MSVSRDIKDIAKELGKMGGLAIKQKVAADPDYFRRLGKKGMKKRWDCKDIDAERVCHRNGLKYRPGGICPCFKV